MDAKINPQHPYIIHKDELAKEDVMVLEDVKGAFTYGDSCTSYDLLIVLCHQGTIYNQSMPDPTFSKHDICILLPNQIVISQRASEDFRATMIAISKNFYGRLLHTYPYTRYTPRYRNHPSTHLTDHQYETMLDAIGLLKTITKCHSIHRGEMLSNLLSIIINLIGESNVENHPGDIKISPNELLFSRFYDAIIRHHSESHEMAFYAHLCCLSPKHFSEVIKQVTGTSATEWIATYITIRAKSLLDSRDDFTIQQISHKLGFTEQASFARFFKKQTGMTPSEYRKRVL